MHEIPDPHCPYCKGKGYRYLPSTSRKNFLNLEICQCVEKYCSCDKTPPYLIFNEKTEKIETCVCKSTREKTRNIQKLFQKSGIPIRYLYKKLDHFETDFTDNHEITVSLMAALDMAHQYTDEFDLQGKEKGLGLYIYGPAGTGKTMLACLILNEIILEYQANVLFINITRDFFDPIRSTYNIENKKYGKGEEIFNKIANADLLVIDDFGVQSDSEWEKRTLYDLINIRYEKVLPTILTSNEEPKKWKELFNGRIYSRLEETTDTIFIESLDYRGRISKSH